MSAQNLTSTPSKVALRAHLFAQIPAPILWLNGKRSSVSLQPIL